MLGTFEHFFFHSCFFSSKFTQNILSGIISECQTVWVQIKPDIWSGLIWVQTVCRGYQQMPLASNGSIIEPQHVISNNVVF